MQKQFRNQAYQYWLNLSVFCFFMLLVSIVVFVMKKETVELAILCMSSCFCFGVGTQVCFIMSDKYKKREINQFEMID